MTQRGHYNGRGLRQPFRVVPVRALCALLLVARVRPAATQPPDETPRGGLVDRVSVGGEVTATLGSDDPGFFNDATDRVTDVDGRSRIDSVPVGSVPVGSDTVGSDTVVGGYEGEARVPRTITVARGGATELDLVVP